MWSLQWLCISVVGVAIVTTQPGDQVQVTIQDGILSGIESVTDEKRISCWAFLGIPYAAPPVGNLRFKPPQPVSPWTGVRDATYERSICTQSGNGLDGSEDCLFLNVFTTIKPGNGTNALLPVMVWIHGGGFIFGTGNIGLHGGDRFLDNGVILVSLNYRLGVFGFLCTLDTASQGNYGLKDQIAALKWVQKNIAKFGGDPKQVTIFGESAGATSVNYLLQSNLTAGLYRAAISESGCTLNSWSVANKPRDVAFKVGLLNLIITIDSQRLVDSLRKLDYKQLQTTASQILLELDAYNGLTWSPCMENNVDGAVVTSYNHVKLSDGNFIRVPHLTGFNSNEARVFSSLKWIDVLYSTEFSLIPDKLVPKDMNSVATSAAADKIKKYYFNNQPILNDTKFIHYASDTLFVRAIRKNVQLQSKYTQVYYYRFSFTGGIQHDAFDPEGVSHGEELQFLFNYPNSTQISPAAKLTVARMIKLWTNFAKTRNPTPYPDPDLNFIWPVAITTNYTNITYLDIGEKLVVSVNPQNNDMAFWDELYDEYGFPPYNSY